MNAALVMGTAAIVLFGAIEVVLGVREHGWGSTPGLDFDIYRGAADRLVNGGSWFLDRQLHGTYGMSVGDVLYPPTLAIVVAPFLWIPGALWWAVPLTTLAVSVVKLRPSLWSWPLLATGIVWPLTLARILTGNPAMWLAAALSLTTWTGWAAALVFIKPTTAPFALMGARSRSWWAAAVALVAMTLLLPQGTAYPSVLLDARIGESWLYGVVDFPLLSVPIVAWLARTSTRRSTRPGLPPAPRPRLVGFLP